MLESTAELGQALLQSAWNLFSIPVPGFDFTFGGFWLGVLLCSLSLLVARALFGIGGRSRGESARTGSTSRPRIAPERRNDEF